MRLRFLAPLVLLALLAGLVACARRARLMGTTGIDCRLGQQG
jgi:hypothetical protein